MSGLMMVNPRRRRNSWFGQPRRHSWARKFGSARRRRRNPRGISKKDIMNYATNVFDLKSIGGGITGALVVYATPKYFNLDDWKDPVAAGLVTIAGGYVLYNFVDKKVGDAYSIVGGTITAMKALRWVLGKLNVDTSLLSGDDIAGIDSDLGMIAPVTLNDTGSADEVLFGDALEPTFGGN